MERGKMNKFEYINNILYCYICGNPKVINNCAICGLPICSDCEEESEQGKVCTNCRDKLYY